MAVTYKVLHEKKKEEELANERFPGFLVGKIVSRQKDSEDDVVFKFRVSNESLYLVTLAELVSFFFKLQRCSIIR